MKPSACECGHWVEDHKEFVDPKLNRCDGDTGQMSICPCPEFREEREEGENAPEVQVVSVTIDLEEPEMFRRAAIAVLSRIEVTSIPGSSAINVRLTRPGADHVNAAVPFPGSDGAGWEAASRMESALKTMAAFAERGWK